MSRPHIVPTDELVAICEWAHRTGRNMPDEVAEHFGIDIAQARNVVKARRRDGAPIPYVYVPKVPEPIRLTPPAMRLKDVVLSCVCGECFPLDVSQLARHTVQAHRRGPTVAERTPRKVAA